MKKENIYRIFYVLAVLLLIAFIVVLAFDHRLCYKCDPAYFFVLVYRRVLVLLLPALLSLGLGVFLKHNYNR